MPTRFVLLSNELPAFEDASATIASRFIVLMFRRSFYGRENPRLTDELLEEAPAIFNWALEGLDRLAARGHFVQPAASKSAIRHLEDLASPVSAFLRDRCVVHLDATVPKDDIWTAWKEWSEDAGVKRGTKDVLIRDLRAIAPNITSTRPTVDGKRVYMLTCLRLQQVRETIDRTPDTPDRNGARPDSGPEDSPQPGGRSTLSGVEPTAEPTLFEDGPTPDSRKLRWDDENGRYFVQGEA